MFNVLFFILGGAVAIFVYESYAEMEGKKVQRILPQKLDILLEKCSMKIGETQRELNRDLTEDEKDIILDNCYKEM